HSAQSPAARRPRRPYEEPGYAGAAPGRDGGFAAWELRHAEPELPGDEAHEQRGSRDEEADGPAREPAVLTSLRDRVHERGETARDEHRARDVEPLHAGVAALVEQERRERERGRPDRDVDEED